MRLITLLAFEDELSSIQKEAGLKDLWDRGTKPLKEVYEHSGRKLGVHVENALETARKKVPVAGKALKGVGLGEVADVARRLLA